MRFAIPAAGSSGATPATGSNRPRRVRVTFVRARRVVAFVGSRGVATFIRAFRIVMFLAGVCVGVASAAGAAPVDPPANSGSVAEWSDPPALFAAGDSLWVLTHEGTKSSEPSARNTASITVVGRPLAAPAVCATSLPGSRAVLGTLTGVWVGSTDIAAPMQRFLPGSPIRALAVASPERVVALVGDPGPPRDPCEIVLLDCAQGTTIHVADALPTATDLAASMDSTIWVSAAIGRTLQRFTPGFRGWSADSVSVPVQREAPQWSLRLVGTSPSLGPLLLEQGRGTNPSLITMRPVRS
ncbi:MAG: hypothetical protein KC729_20980, partial [Candidatus Eisenbacteria bacterium]|nr:hypothetical protein [Candidatus Eisenbacteria bacterium]